MCTSNLPRTVTVTSYALPSAARIRLKGALSHADRVAVLFFDDHAYVWRVRCDQAPTGRASRAKLRGEALGRSEKERRMQQAVAR